MELKSKSKLYVPISYDLLDQKLAKFINTSEDPFKLLNLFTREKDGVYKFGSKKIFMKLQNDQIYGKKFVFNFFG